MKIDLYTKGVLTVIAKGIGFLVFEQKPVKEVHAGYHDTNARLQLLNRMAKMEKNFKRFESDFVKNVTDYRRYKVTQRKMAQWAAGRCQRMGDGHNTLLGNTPQHTHKSGKVKMIVDCLYGWRHWVFNTQRVQ